MPDAPNSPLRIGRYALYAEIASGGMASVHFARLLGPGGFSRIVAAKRLLPRIARNRAFTSMLLDEARLAARIRHPNVLSTLDVISTDCELVVVMEYLHGEALSRLAQVASDLGEPISPQVATGIVIDALHGLHAAHDATDESGRPLGVVHRDISPQNLLVGVDGVTRISDFGIAKAAGRSYETRDGTIKGKLAYMAPEQIEGSELTRATDVFAISVVLWELLAGRRLFAGNSDGEVVYRVLSCEIPTLSSLVPELPAQYDRILRRGLSRDPALRFGSAREMALELEAFSPPLRPSDIGAWVERIASDTLQFRSHLISKIERSSTADAGVAPTPSSAPSPQVTPAPPSSGDIDRSLVAGLPRRGSSWLPLAAISGLALGGLSALPWMPRGEPAASAARRSAASNSALSAVAASAHAPAAPRPRAAVTSTPDSAAAALPAPSAVPRKAHKAASSAGKATTARADPPQTTVSCDPPYSLDASGRRLFKLECM
ncbi:MAG TPA: serine/threonine-protein kinase [Polyangiaceae bacterium]|nr:serine/threonine-protein kinase [Polyangiaceae bacterium]